MPIVLKEDCIGCGLCVEACGPKSLIMIDGIAALAFADTCGSEEHCISVCRDDAIHMAWLPFSGNRGIFKWREESEHDTLARPVDSQVVQE